MDLTRRNERRRVLRKAQSHTFRRGTFVADYVQNKYNNIYVEAMQFYDLLNNLYPGKTDLKKTEEYRVWKNNVTRDLSSYINLQQAPRQHHQLPNPSNRHNNQNVYIRTHYRQHHQLPNPSNRHNNQNVYIRAHYRHHHQLPNPSNRHNRQKPHITTNYSLRSH